MGDGRVVALASAVFVLLNWVWAFSTPLMHAPDEPTHAVRAASLWRGTIKGTSEEVVTPVTGSTTGAVARGEVTNVRVPSAYAELQQMPDCFKFAPARPAGCAPAVSSDTTVVDTTTLSGAYQPTYFVLVGWPTRLLPPEYALYAMRLVGGTICGLLLGSAFASAYRAARRPFVVVGAALAVTPMTIFLSGVINPSGLEITAALATWLGLLQLLVEGRTASTSLLVRMAVAASLLAATRPLGPAFLAVVVVMVMLAAADRRTLAELARDRRVLWGGGVVAVVVAASVAWVLAARSLDALAGESIPGLSVAAAVREHLELWGFRARQMVGRFGNADSPIPDAIVWLWLGAVAILVAVALWAGSTRQRVAVAGVVALTFVIPLASEVRSAADYGFIWQGRYALPFAIGVPVLAAWTIGDARRPRSELTRASAVLVALAVPMAQLVSYLALMTRVVVGYPKGLLEYLTGDGWEPPLPSWFLLVGAVVAVCAYAALLWVLGRDESPVGTALAAAGRDATGGVSVPSERRALERRRPQREPPLRQ